MLYSMKVIKPLLNNSMFLVLPVILLKLSFYLVPPVTNLAILMKSSPIGLLIGCAGPMTGGVNGNDLGVGWLILS